jgi:hypothetical protein
MYEGEGDVLIGRAERSTFLNSELKWFAAVKGQDCDDSDAHNNCVLLAVDEYKMTWQFIACMGYPWNFAWVNMPSDPVVRMAIQVAIHQFIATSFLLRFICRRPSTLHAHARCAVAPCNLCASQIASIEKDYMLHHHKGSPCHGWYWLGMLLLFVAGAAVAIALCVGAYNARQSMFSAADNGEQRPLLS